MTFDPNFQENVPYFILGKRVSLPLAMAQATRPALKPSAIGCFFRQPSAEIVTVSSNQYSGECLRVEHYVYW